MPASETSPNTSPWIQLMGVQVMENAPAGTAIGFIHAVDKEGDDYSLTLIDDAQGRFRMENGQIFVADPTHLDYETCPWPQIVVRAVDSSGASRDTTFTI